MFATVCVALVGLLAVNAAAQKFATPMYIQREAMREQQQMGQTFNMTL